MHRLDITINRTPLFADDNLLGSGWAKRHLRIRARSATGRVAGAAIY
jgi:hypothetical protein